MSLKHLGCPCRVFERIINSLPIVFFPAEALAFWKTGMNAEAEIQVKGMQALIGPLGFADMGLQELTAAANRMSPALMGQPVSAVQRT